MRNYKIMSDPLTHTIENKLNDLNKKIAEIKKKIQLSGEFVK